MRELTLALLVVLLLGAAISLTATAKKSIQRLEAAQSRLLRLECIHARELGITCIVTNDKEGK